MLALQHVVLAFSAPLTTNKATEAPWPTCTFSSTDATDLTKACTPPMVEGSFLLFDDRCKKAKAQNTDVLSAALSRAPHGSTLLVPAGTYHLNAGVYAELVNGTTLQLEGTLHFGGATLQSHKSVRDNWPGFNESNPGHSSACNCFTIKRFIDFQLVSSGRGVINGGGESWYGYRAIGQIGIGNIDGGLSGPKPAMINFGRATDPNDPKTAAIQSRGLVMRNVWFCDSGYWSLLVRGDDVEIGYCNVTARQEWKGRPPTNESTTALDAATEALRMTSSFNTDGIDVIGDRVYIHDGVVDVEDDCIGMKGGKDWLVERMSVSGAGLSIGTLAWGRGAGPNVTFRNIRMFQTLRAIYVKPGGHFVTGVVYENISVGTSYLFPIWVGPPYQELQGSCPLLWPFVTPAVVSTLSEFLPQLVTLDPSKLLCKPTDVPMDVTLRNVRIEHALTAPRLYHGTNLTIVEDNVTIGRAASGHFPFGPLPGSPYTDPRCRGPGSGAIPHGLGHCCEDATFVPLGSDWGECTLHPPPAPPFAPPPPGSPPPPSAPPEPPAPPPSPPTPPTPPPLPPLNPGYHTYGAGCDTCPGKQ